MKIRIQKIRSEQFFIFFLCLYWGQDIVFNYMRAVLLHIPVIKYFGDYFFSIMIGICLLLSMPYMIKVIKWKDIIFVMSVVFTYLLHLLVYWKNSETLLLVAVSFFTVIFPMYFIGLRFEISKYITPIYLLSIINIWIFVFYNLFYSENVLASQATYTSYLHRAYVLLPQILVVIGGMISNTNFLNVSTVVVGTLYLMMCGNRGSVLLLLIYCICYILFIMENRRRASIYVIAISCCSIVMVFYEQLIEIMMNLFLHFGMSTRVIEKITKGSFFQSIGRNDITYRLWNAIWEKPILGHGLMSDRLITGSYAHNYVFELWSSFGIIFGTILLVMTIYVIFKAWRKVKDKATKSFILVLVCTGFLKLFISSSFLEEELFFMLLGVCVMQIRKSKNIG